MGCHSLNKGEDRNPWSEHFSVRVCKNRCSFSKGNNHCFDFDFFTDVKMYEALTEGPHPHKHKNDGGFFQLVPHNPKVYNQSDSLKDQQGKKDTVMCPAHAHQTQSYLCARETLLWEPTKKPVGAKLSRI